jgi:hypothetical protein
MDVFCQSNNRRQFWSTNDDGDNSSSAGGSAGPAKTVNTKQEFDFAELEPTSTEESVAEQKVCPPTPLAAHTQ